MEEKGDVKKTDVDLEINLYFLTVNNQGSPAWNHNFSTPHTGRPKGKKTKENKLHITQIKKKRTCQLQSTIQKYGNSARFQYS